MNVGQRSPALLVMQMLARFNGSRTAGVAQARAHTPIHIHTCIQAISAPLMMKLYTFTYNANKLNSDQHHHMPTPPPTRHRSQALLSAAVTLDRQRALACSFALP